MYQQEEKKPFSLPARLGAGQGGHLECRKNPYSITSYFESVWLKEDYQVIEPFVLSFESSLLSHPNNSLDGCFEVRIDFVHFLNRGR